MIQKSEMLISRFIRAISVLLIQSIVLTRILAILLDRLAGALLVRIDQCIKRVKKWKKNFKKERQQFKG